MKEKKRAKIQKKPYQHVKKKNGTYCKVSKEYLRNVGEAVDKDIIEHRMKQIENKKSIQVDISTSFLSKEIERQVSAKTVDIGIDDIINNFDF